jgi:hypothetical protein
MIVVSTLHNHLSFNTNGESYKISENNSCPCWADYQGSLVWKNNVLIALYTVVGSFVGPALWKFKICLLLRYAISYSETCVGTASTTTKHKVKKQALWIATLVVISYWRLINSIVCLTVCLPALLQLDHLIIGFQWMYMDSKISPWESVFLCSREWEKAVGWF